MINLQSKIRKERKDRWELKLLIFSGITGIVGSITGLVAVILAL